MEYRRFFDDAISKLKGERRYRVFADLERDANSFPRALWRTGHGQLRGGHSQYPWQVADRRGGRLSRRARPLPSHTHAKSAFIYAYVISGAIEFEGERRRQRASIKAGESWSEPPGAIHSISRNASKTEPAKLLAVFVVDTNDNPLTTPIK